MGEARYSVGQVVLCRHKGRGFIFWGAVEQVFWGLGTKSWHYRVRNPEDGGRYYQTERTILGATPRGERGGEEGRGDG